MPAPYSLRSPNGLTIIYFVAEDVTGPVVSQAAIKAPQPGAVEIVAGPNVMMREETVTFIACFVAVSTAGEETGVATGANQAAAEAATPTGSGMAALEALLAAARTWHQQAGGRTRGGGAYPTAGGNTTTGEVTLIMGTKDDGVTLHEYQGILESVSPTWSPKKNDQGAKVFRATINFRIATIQGA